MNRLEPMVFVVDDDISVRRALERLIKSVQINVETYETADDFLSRPQYKGPNCLVLDIRMPGLSGLDLQEELIKVNNMLPIIFMTGHGTIPMSVRAMKAGAVDFLEKPFEDQALLDLIKRAIECDRQNKAHDEKNHELVKCFESLTSREKEVFSGVVSGKLNKQVAFQLGISEKTVKVHRANMMRKMRAKSLADLVHISEQLPKTKV